MLTKRVTNSPPKIWKGYDLVHENGKIVKKTSYPYSPRKTSRRMSGISASIATHAILFKKSGHNKYSLLPEKTTEVVKWQRINADLWGLTTLQNNDSKGYKMHACMIWGSQLGKPGSGMQVGCASISAMRSTAINKLDLPQLLPEGAQRKCYKFKEVSLLLLISVPRLCDHRCHVKVTKDEDAKVWGSDQTVVRTGNRDPLQNLLYMSPLHNVTTTAGTTDRSPRVMKEHVAVFAGAI
eukprot:jgi/Psemu1/58581/gm1.58581_g